MNYTFCVDFGSTFTKLCVLDLENGEAVMTARHPTTVATDAAIALEACLAEAKRYTGERGVKNGQFLASSSAAGGLRMVVVGLTRKFSLMAGKNVALGAGARIIKTYENYLSKEDIDEIEGINPELILLCGGIEGGNTDRVLHNASMLKTAQISSYVVYAGNHDIASYVRGELMQGSIKCYFTENVFPAYGKINGKPAGDVIRHLFMERIAGVKGLASVFPIIGNVRMPTPAAVLEGGLLVSRGTEKQTGFGAMLAFDVGGATTDVYSFAEETQGELRSAGVPQPFAKRTVEGDLGVRSSCLSLAEAMNLQVWKERPQFTCEQLRAFCELRGKNDTYVAENQLQREFDFMLAGEAVAISARRHCGKIMNAYEKNANEVVEGKDLTRIGSIIGTGGPIIHSDYPEVILRQALRKAREREMLLPEKAELYVDRRYLLYAVGLAAAVNPEGALHIAKENIVKVG